MLKVKEQEEENIHIKTEMYMMENGEKMRNMVLAY